MKKKRLAFVVSLTVAFAMLLALFTPVNVSAEVWNPFNDVSKKSVGKTAYKSILQVYYEGAFIGIADGTKFKPNKKVTKKEAIKVLRNYYGKKNVPVTKADKRSYKKIADYKWLYKKLSAISRKQQIFITGDFLRDQKGGLIWDTSYGNKTKVTRAKLAVTLAAIKNPYKDVTKKTVNKDQWAAIMYVKAHKGYKGIISGKKFKPNKKVTRGEAIKMLVNFYGKNKIPKKYVADISSKKLATTGWFASMFSDLESCINGDPIDQEVEEYGKNMTRAETASMLRSFILSHPINSKAFPKH